MTTNVNQDMRMDKNTFAHLRERQRNWVKFEAYADAGVPDVHIVVRPNGAGPVWISYPWVMGGSKRLESLLSVRWMTWFSPCIFGKFDLLQVMHS